MAAGTITIGDLKVNRLGFGAMRITGNGIWGPPRDHDEAIRVLRRAVELGVTLIDTADAYGPNISEELIAEALHPYPTALVIATKGGKVGPGPGHWATTAAPSTQGGVRGLAKAAPARPDRRLPAARARPESPARGIGRSAQRSPVRRQDPPRRPLERHGRASSSVPRKIVPIVSVQNLYNADDRSSEDVLAACETARDPVLAVVPARRRVEPPRRSTRSSTCCSDRR